MQPRAIVSDLLICERPHMHAVRRFLSDDRGIAVTEYGLLVALIAVLLIGVVALFGSSISSWFKAKTDAITTT
jgi:Flp pilus assembly pilin Flp